MTAQQYPFHLDVPRAFYEAHMGNGANVLLLANRPLFRWGEVVDNGDTLRLACRGPCPASAAAFMGLLGPSPEGVPEGKAQAARAAGLQAIVCRLDSLHARATGMRKARRKAKNARARANRKTPRRRSR